MTAYDPYVSIKNHTRAPLSGGATYTGDWEDVSKYEAICVACKTDADGTLFIEFTDSKSDSTADSSLSYPVFADSNEVHRLTITRQWFRVRMVNGASAQTVIGLTSMIGHYTTLTSPGNSTVSDDADTIVTRSIPSNLDIATGRRQGYAIFEKFGQNSDISTSGNEDIWDGGGLYTGFATAAETVQAFSSDSNDDLGGTGAEILRIQGLDANFENQTEDLTLDGTNPVVTTNTFIRVNRTFVIQSANGANTAFNTGNITLRQSTTTANVFTIIGAGRGQSRIAAYTVPLGKTLYLSELDVQISKASGSGVTATGAIYRKDFGLPPRYIEPFSVSDTVGNVDNIMEGIVIPAKSSITLRIITCSANSVVFFGKMRGYLVDD